MRDGLNLFGPSAQRRVCDAQKLSSDAHGERCRINPSSLISAIVVVIII
jgi:hypothetical protein